MHNSMRPHKLIAQCSLLYPVLSVSRYNCRYYSGLCCIYLYIYVYIWRAKARGMRDMGYWELAVPAVFISWERDCKAQCWTQQVFIPNSSLEPDPKRQSGTHSRTTRRMDSVIHA